MKLSVVTTLHQSSSYIKEFHKRASASAKSLAADDYEIIMVNDGSTDDSLDIAIGLTKIDSHVIVIDLSRNFGHHKAMMTGLAQSIGDYVFLIDSDLEEMPEWLEIFESEMRSQSCDVVFGVQERRKGGYFERISGKLFYWSLNLLSDLELPKDVVTARLMTRRYVENLLKHKEREVFLAGLWHTTGYKQIPLTVNKLDNSSTTYSLKNKLRILVNSVTSFSNAPLRAIFYIGVSISFVAAIYVSYIVIQWLRIEEPVTGWASLIASVWLLGGITISCLGVIGIYLSKIFSETKQRPYTIIRQVYGQRHP